MQCFCNEKFNSLEVTKAYVSNGIFSIMIRIMRESVIDHENSESGIKPNILEDLKTPSKPESNDLQTKFEKPRKPANESNDKIDEHKEQSNG